MPEALSARSLHGTMELFAVLSFSIGRVTFIWGIAQRFQELHTSYSSNNSNVVL